jgi:hypothetical protein
MTYKVAVITLIALMSVSCVTKRILSADSQETAIRAYCKEHQLERKRLEPCYLDIIPKTKMFRYKIPANPKKPGEAPSMRLKERYVVLFLNTETMEILKLKKRTFYDGPSQLFPPLFTAMKKAGKKITTNDEASAILQNLFVLDGWLHYLEIPPHILAHRNPRKIKVNGPYKQYRTRYGGKNKTFGAGMYAWEGGDDLGLEIDADGYIIRLLGAHVR